MDDVEQVRLWASLHGWSFASLPLGLVDTTFMVGSAVLVVVTWLRLMASVVMTRTVRKQPRKTLAVGLLTGPIGVIVLRRRLQQLLPVRVLKVRPQPRTPGSTSRE